MFIAFNFKRAELFNTILDLGLRCIVLIINVLVFIVFVAFLSFTNPEISPLNKISYIYKEDICSDEVFLYGLILKEKDGKGREAVEKAIHLINEGLNGNYAFLDEKGRVSLSLAKKKAKKRLTGRQKVFYDVICEAINSKKSTVISISEGSEFVIIGSYDDQEIDISDVNNYGTDKRVNKFSVFAHEIKEQYSKQTKGKNWNSAHRAGLVVEEKITGYSRLDGLGANTHTEQDERGRVSGNLNTVFEKSNHRIEVCAEILNGNIVDITLTNQN